jgi:(p)ppGpp synthase/HD superfamily hydrolase
MLLRCADNGICLIGGNGPGLCDQNVLACSDKIKSNCRVGIAIGEDDSKIKLIKEITKKSNTPFAIALLNYLKYYEHCQLQFDGFSKNNYYAHIAAALDFSVSEETIKKNFISINSTADSIRDKYSAWQLIKQAEDFYNTLGFGGISLQRHIPKIKEEIERLHANDEPVVSAEDEISKIKLTTTKRNKSSNGIIIDGEPGCQIKFAKCCNPLPGDKLAGFITRGYGVSIHKADCPNVLESRKNEENLARWVRAEWEKSAEESHQDVYEAAIQIVTEDGIGIIAGISNILLDMRVSISKISNTPLKNGDMQINLVIGCKNTAHFDSIVARLRSLPKVISISRRFSN